MDANPLKLENDLLREEIALLRSALEDARARLTDPEEVIRAIQQGEIDALVMQQEGREEIYSLLRVESVYRTVIEECFPHGVWLAETDGKLLYVSPSFLQLIRTDLDEVCAKGQFHFLSPDAREPVEREWARCRQTGEPFKVEYPLRAADGSDRIIWTQGMLAHTHDGHLRWAGVNIDVTERASFKDDLRRQAEVLQARTADLEQANTLLRQSDARYRERTAQLETANKEMEAFCYSVSHDLRAPLRAIDGFAQALHDAHGDRLDAQGAHYLQRMRAASQRMAQLIDDLLLLSRLSRGEMKFAPVDLTALAHAVAAELQQREPARRVTLTVQPGLTARGDARLLRVVLENLLANAWKFTSKLPRATVAVGRAAGDGPPTFFVRDDGAGFNEAFAGNLFGPFQRLHSERDFPGTGIGLAIVQRVVQRHGGNTRAEGTVGKGATFYFTLPDKDDAPAPTTG
jgi:PAS domain S-box-containing protein